jgi:signal peptidase I
MKRNSHPIIAIILFLAGFLFPLLFIPSFFVIWKYTSWPSWLKLLLIVPIFLLFPFFILLSVFAFIYLFAFRPYKIVGTALEPAYRNNSYVMSEIIRNDTEIKRGDVVIFKSPNKNSSEMNSAKRIIGLPGEKIMLKSGSVYINDQPLNESSYLFRQVTTYSESFLGEYQPYLVPANYYFIMGDNRSKSLDSREFGPVPRDLIISIARLCYWNCSR